jgi:hypothetical protein
MQYGEARFKASLQTERLVAAHQVSRYWNSESLEWSRLPETEPSHAEVIFPQIQEVIFFSDSAIARNNISPQDQSQVQGKLLPKHWNHLTLLT